MADALTIWTVYDHPSDFPNGFIARRFEVDATGARPTDDVMRSADLQPLRNILLDKGLTCLARNENDEPQIVESWL